MAIQQLKSRGALDSGKEHGDKDEVDCVMDDLAHLYNLLRFLMAPFKRCLMLMA